MIFRSIVVLFFVVYAVNRIVLGTVFAGRTIFVLFKQTVKGGNTGEACLHSNFCNGKVRFC